MAGKPRSGVALLGLCLLAVLPLKTAAGGIEGDIAALDDATKKQLAHEMAAHMETRETTLTKNASPSRAGGIEEDIAALDDATKKQLAHEMAVQMETRETASPRNAGSFQGALPQSRAPETAALQTSNSSSSTVSLLPQPEEHFFITTGDRVWFSVPPGRTLEADERLIIYKRSSTGHTPARGDPQSGNEQVGKLKVLGLQKNIAWGCVVLANDIILAGDAVSLPEH